MDENTVLAGDEPNTPLSAAVSRQFPERTSLGQPVAYIDRQYESSDPGWWGQAMQRAKSRWAGIRVQAQHWTRAYPTQALLTFAGVAFTTGVLLRMGKRND